MKIVDISNDDWKDLKEIRLASLLESPSAFGVCYGDAINYTAEDWKLRASANGGPRFFISYVKCTPVGLIGGVFVNKEYELISMWVSPQSRGAGIGSMLVDAIKQHATKEGHKSIMLKVSPDNKVACNLYSKCGFQIVGEGGSLASNKDIQLQKMVWSADVQP